MTKPVYEGPAAVLVRYEQLVADHGVAERKGTKTPYTSCNGHMFSFLDASGTMALRLPAVVRCQLPMGRHAQPKPTTRPKQR